MGRLELDYVRLSPVELDDQALAEISALLAAHDGRSSLALSRLIDMAAAGDLVVARRACGALPEIVGVAARMPAGDVSRKELIAVDKACGAAALADALKRRLNQPASTASLFRRRDRAPLGLMNIFA